MVREFDEILRNNDVFFWGLSDGEIRKEIKEIR
jgi:hypothetical protein